MACIPTVAAGITENGLSFSSVDDGKYITYKAFLNKSDIFEVPKNIHMFDFEKDCSIIVTANDDGLLGNSYSSCPSISSGGAFVAFASLSTNFGNYPICSNIWLKSIKDSKLLFIKDHAVSPEISKSGRYIVYEYNADPEKGLPAIYMFDIERGEELFIDYTSLGNKAGWYYPHPHISDDDYTITYTTTKSGKPEIWKYNGGKVSYVTDGFLK